MPTDFAGRQRKKPKAKYSAKKNTARKSKKLLFHGPSFSGGTIVGAIMVFMMAYAPDYLLNNSTDASLEDAQNLKDAPQIEITFPQLLKESRVLIDVKKYPVPIASQNTSAKVTKFYYQTASFKDLEEAKIFRAKLLLNNLPASIKTRKIERTVWHRVLIGPFESKEGAVRVLAKLNSLNIPAIQVYAED